MRAAITDYLGRLRCSWAWSESHKPLWAPIVARSVDVPETFIARDLATESQPYQLVAISNDAIASCQDVADVLAQAKLLPHAVSVAPYFDRSFGPALSQS